MRTFLGIAAGLTLASGVALVAASDQQVVKERRTIEQAPPSWAEAGGDDLVGQPMVRRLAVLDRGAELGITIKDLDEQQAKTSSGVVVDAVAENSAAAKAGIKKGDVVTDFDGERVRSTRQLSRLVDETPEGRTVKTTVLRDGKRVELSVTPEAPAMARLGPGENFEFAVPPGHGGDMLPPGQGKRFFFDMHPPADGDFMFRHTDGHGRLGIGIQDLTPQLGEYFGTKDGVLVTNVEADTPAARAGLKAGDVITSINGKPIADPGQLIESVQSAAEGAELSIGYLRDHKAGSAKATLTPRERPKVEQRGEPI